MKITPELFESLSDAIAQQVSDILGDQADKVAFAVCMGNGTQSLGTFGCGKGLVMVVGPNGFCKPSSEIDPSDENIRHTFNTYNSLSHASSDMGGMLDDLLEQARTSIRAMVERDAEKETPHE